MNFDRSTMRALGFSGATLLLMAVGMLLSTGLLQTLLFLGVAAGGVILSVLIWPEALVMAYLFAGRYGYEARLAPGDLPISLNQMMLIGLVVLGLVHGRHLLRVLTGWSSATLILFSLVTLLGLGWSLGPSYGIYKVSRTWLVIVPGVLIAAALIERRGSLLPMIGAMFIVGFALNSAALLTFQSSMHGTNRLSGLGSGPNVFSRTVGLSLLISLLTIIHLYQSRIRTGPARALIVAAALSVVWLLPGFVFAQSRGPVLSLLAAMILVVTLSVYGNWRTVIAGVASLVVSWYAGSFFIRSLFTHSRFDLTAKSNYASMDGRVGLLWDTWDMILEHPLLGVGTGGWTVQMFGIDDRSYPHNFFAEIAAENGLVIAAMVGLAFLFAIFRGIRVWFSVREPRSRFVLLGTLAAFVYFLINIQISGDTIDNRLIWLMLVTVELAAHQALKASAALPVATRDLSFEFGPAWPGPNSPARSRPLG